LNNFGWAEDLTAAHQKVCLHSAPSAMWSTLGSLYWWGRHLSVILFCLPW
jgi:hypothetical protein